MSFPYFFLHIKLLLKLPIYLNLWSCICFTFDSFLLPGVSVSVSCFTLVAISLERYFAVCRPLQSRTWQTLSHAYLTIAICWVLSGVVTIPIGTYTKLKSYHSVNKCREVWTSDIALKVYTISLNHILLLFPMIVMSIAYGLIMKMLWKGLQIETQIDKGKK